MEAGLQGAQKLPPPGKKPSHEPGRGPAKPQTEAGARRPQQVEAERRSEGRKAGRPARSAPPPAGLGSRAAGKQGARAGRREK